MYFIIKTYKDKFKNNDANYYNSLFEKYKIIVKYTKMANLNIKNTKY